MGTSATTKEPRRLGRSELQARYVAAGNDMRVPRSTEGNPQLAEELTWPESPQCFGRAVVMFAHCVGLSREDQEEGRRLLALFDDKRAGGEPASFDVVGDGAEITGLLGDVQQGGDEADVAAKTLLLADEPARHAIEEAAAMAREV